MSLRVKGGKIGRDWIEVEGGHIEPLHLLFIYLIDINIDFTHHIYTIQWFCLYAKSNISSIDLCFCGDFDFVNAETGLLWIGF